MSHTMTDAFTSTMEDLLDRTPDLMVLDADTGSWGPATRLAAGFPDRLLRMGVSEGDLVSTAAGLAASGVGVVALVLAPFVGRAWEQLRTSRPRAGAPFVLVGLGAGAEAASHHGPETGLDDLALVRLLPDLRILVPGDGPALRALLFQVAADRGGPAYLRVEASADSGRPGPAATLGQARLLREGTDVTVAALGTCAAPAMEAAEALRRDGGPSARVLAVDTLSPLDEDGLAASARLTLAVVTVEDHGGPGGFGEALGVALMRRSPARVLAVTADGDRPVTPAAIAAAVVAAAERAG